jgi:hypothetical protein
MPDLEGAQYFLQHVKRGLAGGIRKKMSPAYTTCWGELPKVFAIQVRQQGKSLQGFHYFEKELS